MVMKRNFILKNQTGAALVIALIMMIVLTLVGLASTLTSTFEMKISGNKKGSTSAFYASESGIQILTVNIQNFAASNCTHLDPSTGWKCYDPFNDKNNPNLNPTRAAANIAYYASNTGAPRGAGVSATNFGFQHFGITSKAWDSADVSTNPSGCQLEERVVRLIPTQEGGY